MIESMEMEMQINRLVTIAIITAQGVRPNVVVKGGK
jgi:hypothetical protein